MGSAAGEAALAKVYQPDIAIDLSPQDNTAVHLSDGIQRYITSQLWPVNPLLTSNVNLPLTP